MAGQTSFSQTPTAGLEGMLTEQSVSSTVVRSYVVEDSAGLGAGRFVKNGTTLGTHAKALTATDEKIIGVTVLDLAREPTSPRYPQKADVPVAKDCTIWLTCVDDMRTVDSGPVYVCFSGANAGLPQASAVGGDLALGVECIVGGNTGALGLFRVNLPA